MKLNISLSVYNGDGVAASIESTDEDFDRVMLNESFSMSPQLACRNAAKKLRDAAARFELLGKHNRDDIFNSKTHEAINNDNSATRCRWARVNGIWFETQCGKYFSTTCINAVTINFVFCPYCGRNKT